MIYFQGSNVLLVQKSLLYGLKKCTLLLVTKEMSIELKIDTVIYQTSMLLKTILC